MKIQQIKPYDMDWKPMVRVVPEWFRDAKFGLFFHWGPYCVPACENEWYSRNMYCKGLSQNLHHVERYGELSEFGYKDFYKEFTGEFFDADAWAELVVIQAQNMRDRSLSMPITFQCGTAASILLTQ